MIFGDQPTLALVGPLCEPDKKILHAEPVVFVDKGSHFQNSLEIGFKIGDGDSSAVEMDQLLSQDKDVSDLGFVLRTFKHRYETLNLFGFLGGHRDHELMNFGEVHRYLRNLTWACTVKFYAQSSPKVLALASGKFEFSHHGVFSTFGFEEMDLKLSGACRYPILQGQSFLELSSHGLSNVASGRIEIECSRPLFILFR